MPSGGITQKNKNAFARFFGSRLKCREKAAGIRSYTKFPQKGARQSDVGAFTKELKAFKKKACRRSSVQREAAWWRQKNARRFHHQPDGFSLDRSAKSPSCSVERGGPEENVCLVSLSHDRQIPLNGGPEKNVCLVSLSHSRQIPLNDGPAENVCLVSLSHNRQIPLNGGPEVRQW